MTANPPAEYLKFFRRRVLLREPTEESEGGLHPTSRAVGQRAVWRGRRDRPQSKAKGGKRISAVRTVRGSLRLNSLLPPAVPRLDAGAIPWGQQP